VSSLLYLLYSSTTLYSHFGLSLNFVYFFGSLSYSASISLTATSLYSYTPTLPAPCQVMHLFSLGGAKTRASEDGGPWSWYGGGFVLVFRCFVVQAAGGVELSTGAPRSRRGRQNPPSPLVSLHRRRAQRYGGGRGWGGPMGPTRWFVLFFPCSFLCPHVRGGGGGGDGGGGVGGGGGGGRSSRSAAGPRGGGCRVGRRPAVDPQTVAHGTRRGGLGRQIPASLATQFESAGPHPHHTADAARRPRPGRPSVAT
jgi:hypothetical protein